MTSASSKKSLLPSVVITDRFNCKIEPGDWVLYVPVDPGSPGGIMHGQIRAINHLGSLTFIRFEGWDDKHFTQPHKCVRFSQEEMLMRKLESGL
jgi:hypothetical protein